MAWFIPQVQALVAKRRQKISEEHEIEARVATRVAMNDILDPVVRLLGRIAVEPAKVRRDLLRAQAVPVVLASATQLIGPDRARACWFELREGPPRVLIPVDSSGRAGSVRSTFAAGTPDGDAAINMVLADEDLLCEDLTKNPPPGWDSTRERDYRTFVSVAVIADNLAFGMLTVDALEPGDLTVEDKNLLRLLAGLLASALASASR